MGKNKNTSRFSHQRQPRIRTLYKSSKSNKIFTEVSKEHLMQAIRDSFQNDICNLLGFLQFTNFFGNQVVRNLLLPHFLFIKFPCLGHQLFLLYFSFLAFYYRFQFIFPSFPLISGRFFHFIIFLFNYSFLNFCLDRNFLFFSRGRLFLLSNHLCFLYFRIITPMFLLL